jgi:hypothetical protein
MYEYGDLVEVYDEHSLFTGQIGIFLQQKGGLVTVELASDRIEYFNRSSLRLHRKMTMSHAEAVSA